MEALPEDHDTARAIAHEVRYNLEIAVQGRTGKRKSAPKVKTACITCKVRRVKCDETKPHCLRCINYWGFCEGYAKPQPRLKPPPRIPSRRAKILIAPALNSGARKKRVVTVQEILGQPYTGPVFETHEENRFFKIFLNSTSAALSGAFDSPIWSYLLPQYSFIEPFIRYGVAALGALTVTFMDVMADRLAGNRRDQENCLATSKDYKKAVALYDKSLQYMRIALSKPNHNIRNALLGCLLASCFEGLHGHNYASVIHAQHGLDIFYNWLDRQPTVKSHSSPLRSPNPTEVDDDLVATMYRLDLHVLSFFDSRSMRTHRVLANHDTQSLESMPSVFLSLSQARHYWDLISCRICHFLAFTLSSTGNKSTAFLFRGRSMPYPEALDAPIGVKLFAQGAHVPVGYEAERAEYSAECKAWERAYAPLSKQLLDASKAQTRGATILLMHAKMMRILLAGAFFKSDMEYDHILPDFQSIYDLAVSIWPSHIIAYDVGVSYNFELGVLPPLFLVVTRCRDHDLRCQVIDLLFTSFHRENCWDSFGIAFIGRWIMRMEEERQASVTCSVDEIHDADPLQLNFSVECLPKGEIQDVLQMTIIQDGLAAAEEEAKSRAETMRIWQRGSSMNYSSGEGISGGLYHGSSSESVKSTRSIGSSKSDVEAVIAEERRVRITRFYVDLNLRRAQLEYTQGPVWGKEEVVVCGDNVVRW